MSSGHPIFKRRCGPRVLRCVEGAWPNTAQEWDSVASSAEGLARQSDQTTDICPVRQTTHTEVVWNGWEALFPSFPNVFIVYLINRPPHLLSCFVCRMSFHFLSSPCKASFARHLPLVAGYTTHPFAQMMVQPLANLGGIGSRTPTENIK